MNQAKRRRRNRWDGAAVQGEDAPSKLSSLKDRDHENPSPRGSEGAPGPSGNPGSTPPAEHALSVRSFVRRNGYVTYHPVHKPHCVHFCKFVEKSSDDDVIRLFRDIMRDLNQKGVKDFHMQIVGAAHSGPQGFFIEVMYGKSHEGPPEIPLEKCIACQPDAELFPGMASKELYLREYDSLHMKVSLDAQGRAAFIITPLRHTEGLDDLSDPEVLDLFRGAARLLKGESLSFSRIVLNHGKYRNLPHLHLKVFIDQAPFDKSKQAWGPQRIAAWKKLNELKPAKQPSVCKFFKEKGFCRYGDQCRYQHPQ